MKKGLVIFTFLLLLLVTLAAGCSSKSGALSCETPQIKEISAQKNGIKIEISPVEGVNSYRILRKNSDGKWAVYAHSKFADYTDEAVESGTQYSYTVLCESEDGKTPLSGYDPEGKSFTYVSAPELSGISCVFGGVKITWKASGGAENYRVFRRTKGVLWEKLADTTSPEYTDLTAKSGETYIYTVRCTDSDGAATSFYDSKGVSITYFDAPMFSGAIAINTKVRLSWRAVEGADSYRLYRRDEETGWVALIDTTALHYVDDTVEKHKTYTYTLRCLDMDGRLISFFDPSGVSVST